MTGHPLNVLIVEDSEDDAFLAVRTLRDAGYDVREERVETPEGMAEALRRGGWDLVLTDNSMPRFSAEEAIRAVVDAGLDVPVIVVSGTMSEGGAVAAMRAGARDFIYKGNLQRLAPAVERELRDAENRWARRVAERSLERATDIQDLVLRNLPLVLYSRKGAGIAWISESSAAVLGFPPMAFLGTSGLWENRVHPLDREAAAPPAPLPPDSPGGGRRTVSSREYRWQRADGKWRWLLDHSVTEVPLPGGGGETLGILWDVTDRKELEEGLLQAQKMEALGRLAAGVSHDFNNMLMVIQGYAELLKSAIPERNPCSRFVTEILNAAHRSSTLTRQLLAFSRRQVLQPRILSLNEVVTASRSLVEKLVSGGVRLELRLDPSLGPVRADPGVLDQAIMNLAVNARDAMEEGGTLTLRTAAVPGGDPRLPRGARPGDWALLEVSDTGCGIPPELMDRIFDPFFTTKEEGRGTGLGLATVKGIVERCSGLLDVESAPGKGTTFRIFLPRCLDAEPERAAAPADGAPGGTETILLVDDEAPVLEVTKGMLEDLGYRVLCASTGEEGLSLLDREGGGVRLVVTDVMMPGMDGRALAHAVAARSPRPAILYISGYPVALGAKERVVGPEAFFLPKPFRREALARKVREALDGAPSPAAEQRQHPVGEGRTG